jgi:hypothetical protein
LKALIILFQYRVILVMRVAFAAEDHRARSNESANIIDVAVSIVAYYPAP